MNQTAPRDGTGGKLGMAFIFGLIGLLVATWAGAQLATLVSHGHTLGASLEDASDALLQLPDHFGDPRSAWTPELAAELPGPIVYWGATLLAFVAVSALVAFALRTAYGVEVIG